MSWRAVFFRRLAESSKPAAIVPYVCGLFGISLFILQVVFLLEKSVLYPGLVDKTGVAVR